MWYSNTNVKWNDETRIECVHILRRNDVIVIGLHVATWQHASRLPWPRAYGLCLTRSDLRQAAATAMLAPVTSASVGFNQTRRRSSSTSTRKINIPSPLDQATTHIGCTEGSCVAACACCAQRYRPHSHLCACCCSEGLEPVTQHNHVRSGSNEFALGSR